MLKKTIGGSCPTSEGFSRYLVGLRYLGQHYCGWQVETGVNKPSISNALQQAFLKVIGSNNFTNLKLSSRTDAGVHALHNYVHVDLARRKEISLSKQPAEISVDELRPPQYTFLPPFEPNTLKNALNYHLNEEEIMVTDVLQKSPDFDCRADCTSRTYIYRIICPSPQYYSQHHKEHKRNHKFHSFHKDYAWFVKKPLNVDAMNNAARHLQGENDFASFQGAGCQSAVSYRAVFDCSVTKFDFGDAQHNNASGVILSDTFLMVSTSRIYLLDIRFHFVLQ